MKLHAYGDSWTEGQGTTDNREEWKNYSWVKIISDKLGIDSINNGVSGNSNIKIFNKVVDDLIEGKIKNDDIVVIMWSSSLRDLVPFLPKNEWVSWSIKHLIEYPHKFVESYQSENEKYNNFLCSFKELYVSNLFNQNYYNIVNQNYIIFLQKMFDFYEVKYVMCDAFESMIIELNKDVNGLKAAILQFRIAAFYLTNLSSKKYLKELTSPFSEYNIIFPFNLFFK